VTHKYTLWCGDLFLVYGGNIERIKTTSEVILTSEPANQLKCENTSKPSTAPVELQNDQLESDAALRGAECVFLCEREAGYVGR